MNFPIVPMLPFRDNMCFYEFILLIKLNETINPLWFNSLLSLHCSHFWSMFLIIRGNFSETKILKTTIKRLISMYSYAVYIQCGAVFSLTLSMLFILTSLFFFFREEARNRRAHLISMNAVSFYNAPLAVFLSVWNDKTDCWKYILYALLYIYMYKLM